MTPAGLMGVLGVLPMLCSRTSTTALTSSPLSTAHCPRPMYSTRCRPSSQASNSGDSCIGKQQQPAGRCQAYDAHSGGTAVTAVINMIPCPGHIKPRVTCPHIRSPDQPSSQSAPQT